MVKRETILADSAAKASAWSRFRASRAARASQERAAASSGDAGLRACQARARRSAPGRSCWAIKLRTPLTRETGCAEAQRIRVRARRADHLAWAPVTARVGQTIVSCGLSRLTITRRGDRVEKRPAPGSGKRGQTGLPADFRQKTPEIHGSLVSPRRALLTWVTIALYSRESMSWVMRGSIQSAGSASFCSTLPLASMM